MSEVSGTFDDGAEPEVTTEVTETPEETTAEATAEPVEATEESTETNPAEENTQDGVQKVINKKHFEMKEAERRAEALAQENAQLRQQLPQAQRPQVPQVPDPYDDDFEAKTAARDQAIGEQNQYDWQMQQQQYQQQVAQQQHQQAEAATLHKSVTTYTDRSEKLGVSAAELQEAGNTVAQYGIPDQITQHILDDDQGPLITKYLAQHPQEIEKMRGMPLIHAGIHISNVIKPLAAGMQRTSNAPAPVDSLAGGGAPKPELSPKGATFE